MPTREARRRAEQLRLEAKTNPALAAVLRKKRAAARKAAATRAANEAGTVLVNDAEHQLLDTVQAAEPDRAQALLKMRQDRAAAARATLAEKRAAGTIKKRKKPARPAPSMDTLAGRIDLKLDELRKTRAQLAAHVGAASQLIAQLARKPPDKQGLRPANMLKVAEYLGVTVEWLAKGGDAPAPQQPAQLVPHAGTVFKTNGKAHPRSHEGRVEATMRSNLDSTMGSLWGLMPQDVQVMIISRMAELLANKGRQQ